MANTRRLVANNAFRSLLIVGASLYSPVVAWSQTGNACDLNQDGVVNILDVQLATNMAVGLSPCKANVVGAGLCNLVLIQRVISAALGGACVTSVPTPHSVSLNWTASTSVNVSGYNVYRAAQSTGPYTKLNSSLVVGTTYTDSAVLAGQTYYYVTTAVDSNNNESAYSNQAEAIVPSP